MRYFHNLSSASGSRPRICPPLEKNSCERPRFSVAVHITQSAENEENDLNDLNRFGLLIDLRFDNEISFGICPSLIRARKI